MDDYTECAFCNEPIDYCQGHGSAQYATRVLWEGQIVSLSLFDTEDEALAELTRLEKGPDMVGPGHGIDVFDQAGDVSAAIHIA